MVTDPGAARHIAAIYQQVAAPDWAATNLDALADVLRDLTWLPEGPVDVRLPADAPPPVVAVALRAAAETAGRPRPLHVAVEG